MSQATLARPIRIFAPLEHQERVLVSAARYKLLRCGRRWTKSRACLYAAVMGHGPIVGDQPRWRGMVQGAHIAWVVRDYPQARAIWREEILPRFEGAEGVLVNKEERSVTILGLGSLTIVTAENIDSKRGSRYHGVVFDEAAHFDLQYCWDEVLRPSLADYRGWAMFPSTPSFAKDGAADRPYGPSYFNLLCEKYLAGELSDEWEEFHGTTRDNPILDPEEVDALYASYDDRPNARDQELDAKLLSGVEGVFFSSWNQAVHVQKVRPPEEAWWGAGMDWGLSSPGWVGLEAFWQDQHGRRSHLAWEWEFQNLPPYQVGYQLGKKLMPYPKPQFIAADSSMWDVGDGRGGKVSETIAQAVQRGLDDACGRSVEGRSRAPQLFPAAKGGGSRLVRATMMRQALHWTPDPKEPSKPLPWGRPELSVDESCTHFIRCLEVLPTDPHNPELPATDGVYDHPYDGRTYLAVVHKPETEKPVRPVNENRSFAAQKFNIKVEVDDGRRFSRRRG